MRKVWYHLFCIWPETGRGEMSEWLKEPVLKTGDVEASVGSNPTLSATFFPNVSCIWHAEVPKWLKGLPC